MVIKTFPNVVGYDVPRAVTVIETKLKGISPYIYFSYRVELYNKTTYKPANRRNEIVFYVDKNNEIATTPYLEYTEIFYFPDAEESLHTNNKNDKNLF